MFWSLDEYMVFRVPLYLCRCCDVRRTNDTKIKRDKVYKVINHQTFGRWLDATLYDGVIRAVKTHSGGNRFNPS